MAKACHGRRLAEVAAIPLRLQRFQILPRLSDHLTRHAGQLRHLQPIAAIGRPLANGVQEHDPIPMLRRIEMHVHAAFDFEEASAVNSK